MHICNECGEKFEEPSRTFTSYETLNGLTGILDSQTYLSVPVCPCCGSDNIREYYGRDEDTEDIETAERVAWLKSEWQRRKTLLSNSK